MLERQTLKFLSQLKRNNNKPWFDAHRPQYEAARIDFTNFIQLVIDALQKTDPTITGLSAKDCMFRINRDIRFSKDKTPYKTGFGASIKRGGRKSPYAGYYFHCEPRHSFIAGGLWMPEPAALKNMRQEIDYNWDEFRSILTDKKFKKVFKDLSKDSEFSLSTMPKGYEKDHPAAEYLKLKSFIVETSVSDEELTKSSLHKKTVAAFEAMQPLLSFINRTIETE
jgi:TIGR02453 family protein